MKATETHLLKFFKNSPQFVIPIYQRAYSWSKKECLQLWEDVLRAGNDDEVTGHFIGSIVYIEKGLSSVSDQAPLLVIDGQQRLTTATLMIEALARVIGDSDSIENFSAKKLRDYYLLNPLEDGEKKYKLILSATDKTTLISLLNQVSLPQDFSIKAKENFDFFLDQIEKEQEKGNLLAICKGLSKLVVVDISLDRSQDNPQLIFESLNSTGRELGQADLIRNFILMGLEHDLQSKLYSQYWRPMEIAFGQEGYALHFDKFIRHYLTMKMGKIPKEREVYEEFKQHSQSPEVNDVESLVSDIRIFAEYYCSMVLGVENNKELKMAFHNLLELRVDVSIPLLLEIYDDYKKEIISAEELLSILRLIESYVFRRAICGIPTNSMNKTFASFSKSLKKDKYLESVQANFKLLTSYKRFPEDEEFKREAKIKDLYNFRNRGYWLRRMENYGRKEPVPVDEYTIEHILPQNENLSLAWRSELGEDWERIQKTYLHTLGNLTLTGYNSEYSDKPFLEKRNIEGGFSESPLRLNRFIATKESWGEEDILDRAEILSKQMTKVWIPLDIEKDVLETYKSKSKKAQYSIEDHPHLLSEPMSSVFEELRKQVLALDSSVTELFLKLYVAYKAETNFVDVIPQAKRLLLSLNIPFSDIDDPKGICRDVSDLGRWGNGDIETQISNIEEIPYIMSLVRQAFEKQMESEKNK